MKPVLLFMLLFTVLEHTAQNSFSTTNSNFQLGIGTKVSIELNYKLCPVYKVSLTGGLGYAFDEINTIGLFPALHAGVLVFNRGSIGADQSKKWSTMQPHFYISGQIALQLDERDFAYEARNVPLYHFSEFTANPLQNPYKTSVSFGSNLIFVQKNMHQFTGFLNLNFAGRVQLSYYNDGGPVLKIAGDKHDRFYTGGAVLSYHGAISDPINLVELSYHKYTGYQKNAFDVADKLQIDFLNYKDSKQFSYNHQRWRLNISSLKNGFGGSFSLYNVNQLDVQDYLHFNTNVPYHPDYFRDWRWMIGGRHEYNATTLPQ